MTGRGCARLSWRDGILTLDSGPGHGQQRFAVGRPGDELVVGDWTCRGRLSIGLYRPRTGQVFLFDGWAGPGRSLAPARVLVTGVVGGTPAVIPSAGGTCARVVVRRSGTVAAGPMESP